MEGIHKNGTDYGFLVHQNSELLRALDELEKTCATLREENGLLRKSSAPETEEKVRRLRRKNTELAVLAKRLEERARKLQEANLKVVCSTYKIAQTFPQRTDSPSSVAAVTLNQWYMDWFLYSESELSKKRKECENLEHEVKKRQKRCLDLVREPCAPLFPSTRAENEELREDLSEVTAQRNSVLEENQRLRAKLENLEQVLKHMREVAERRQQLELEHEQALAILKFKQDEIKRLQRVRNTALSFGGFFVALTLFVRIILVLPSKCRSQSEQFGLLSQELEKFRMQLLVDSTRLCSERADVCPLDYPLPLSLLLDVATALRMGATPHAAGLSRVERSPVTKHRELPTISVSKSGSSSSKSETTHLTPKSDTHVDTASEVEELDIDIAPAPYPASRGAAKLQVFIARYSYNPYDGPNDNPEVELPLTAGEYIYVYGDMDDDGFYEGELMDGRRGLVPSNFVERVSDDDVMSTHHPEMVDMSHNSLIDSSLHSASHQHRLHVGVSASAASGPASAPSDSASALAVPAPLTNGLDLDLEEVGVDIVPYPRKLTLIKQLAKSIIIGWDPPLVPAGWGNVWSYNVYVDQELRLNVPFGAQTKAVLERLDINLKAYRVSVQSLTEKGLSDQLRCSMLVGRDVSVAPTQLRVERITATNANLTWLPSNSNYVHIVSLNDEECELVKAGCYSLCLNNLLPSLQYTVKVEARPHRTPWELPVERREHRSATITFTTLMAGPPDAPLDVQLEHGPSPGIALISWLPVTIDAAGTSNGVRVTGYTIYADKKKVLEVSSPTAGSVLLGPSQIHSLLAAHELTVRTTSAHGESCDSLPVNVPSKLAAIMTGPAVTAPVVPPLPLASPAPAQAPSVAAAAPVLEQHRDTDSPGTIRPFPSITEFIEDLGAKLGTPERIPTPPKAPITDLLNPQDTNLIRPPSTSPLESEVEEEHENTRLVSIEEFLTQDQEPVYCSRQQVSFDFTGLLLFTTKLNVTCTVSVCLLNLIILCKLEAPDSDEEVLEKILKLPPHVYPNKQLFSIPEMTEEEDSSQEEHLSHRSQHQPQPTHLHSRNPEHLHPAPPHHPNPHPLIPPHHHHLNQEPRSLIKEPLPKHGALQVKPKTQHRVLYEGPANRRVSARCPPWPTHNSKDKTLLRGLGDRLRREAMLRSQMAVAAAANPGDGHTPPRPYPVSKTVQTMRSPIGPGVEIDVEYGTDDNEEPVEYTPGEVVVQQMSSEWWVEGAQMEHSRPPQRRGPKSCVKCLLQILIICVCLSACVCVCVCAGGVESPKTKGDSDIRIFVALFSYDPASMSPNPDAAEEELPFSEGQIIKVYGDKDADGFYRGESGGRLGYVPCNMVSEIQVEDEETRQQLLQQGFLSTAASMEKIGTRTHAQLPRRPVPPPKPRRSKKGVSRYPSATAAVGKPAPGARRMVAIFDYDPRESSPNTDIEAELTFSAGDIIHVFGDMDEDGFFYGDLNGHRGLVPSNFLQAFPDDAPVQPAPEPRKESQVALKLWAMP
uniref:RIMS-binding protein 2 n=2 Tax=Oreochromis TaxID=8139 RepID=A0A669DUP4_ORENI